MKSRIRIVVTGDFTATPDVANFEEKLKSAVRGVVGEYFVRGNLNNPAMRTEREDDIDSEEK